MKIALLLSTFPLFASADIGKTLCEAKAEKAVQNNGNGGYDKDGFYAYNCGYAPNKAAVICEVSASKGDGAATDTYRVVLNKSCTRVYRVELTGEE